MKNTDFEIRTSELTASDKKLVYQIPDPENMFLPGRLNHCLL